VIFSYVNVICLKLKRRKIKIAYFLKDGDEKIKIKGE